MKTTTQTLFNAHARILALLLPAAAALHGTAFAADYKLQAAEPGGAYAIDPVHSSVQFFIGHLGVSELPGRFNSVSGNFTLDPSRPEKSQVSLEIPVSSLDTNHAQRDKDLLGPDFFNAKQFPAMRFVSTGVKPRGAKDYVVTGNLTLHGMTRPVTLAVQRIGAGPDPWGGYRSGYIATATLQRSDFGMNYMLEGISDTVKLQLNIEATRK